LVHTEPETAKCSGHIVCDPNCHVTSNSGGSNSGTNSTETQPSYRLTVNVPSHPFGVSTVGVSIATESGHTDQASVPTAGSSSHIFSVPKDQGKWVQVCVNSGNRSLDTCHTYETTGSDMSLKIGLAICSAILVKKAIILWFSLLTVLKLFFSC
jgi:hypothetical protein